MSADPDDLLAAAVTSYIAHGFDHSYLFAADQIGLRLLTLMDHATEARDDADRELLPGCLLILALARRRPGGTPLAGSGLAACLRALRHALAELRIDLPIDPDAVMSADLTVK